MYIEFDLELVLLVQDKLMIQCVKLQP